MMPTADEVAHAIVAAARLCSVDPEAMVGAKIPASGDQLRTARARCYAAMAIDTVFNTSKPKKKHSGYPVSRAAIARMVGAPKASQDGMVHALEAKLLDKRKIGWWRPAVLEGAVAAILRARGALPPHKPQDDAAERPEAAPEPRYAEIDALRLGRVVVSASTAKVMCDGEPAYFGDDLDALGVVAALVKVMPNVLPFDRVAQNVWGHMQDCQYRVTDAAARANEKLAPLGLRIRTVPKLGVAISEV